MKVSNTHMVVAMLSVGVCGITMPSSADAATITREHYQNGGSACTGALPTFEGALRKRPKAIANEGTTSAFVTCSAETNDFNSANPLAVFAGVTNRSGADVNLNCTFINGDEFYGSTSTPQTLALAAGSFHIMGWSPTSPATEFDRNAVSISCALPPGVEINYFGQVVQEDIGN